MGYVKSFLLGLLISGLAGCTTTSQKQSIYEQGYREGVAENIDNFLDKKQTDPLIGQEWIEPIIQEVTIPAHIANGVFIPEHKELVIINPGAWQLEPGYSISKGGQSNVQNKTTLQLFEGNVSNITVLPDQYYTGSGDSLSGEKRGAHSAGMAEED